MSAAKNRFYLMVDFGGQNGQRFYEDTSPALELETWHQAKLRELELCAMTLVSAEGVRVHVPTNLPAVFTFMTLRQFEVLQGPRATARGRRARSNRGAEMSGAPFPFAIGGDLWPGLSKLIEELGEVQQVAGKLIATGGDAAHWDGTDLRARLEEELGDALAAIHFVAMANKLDVEPRAKEKLARFLEWHEALDPAI